MKTLNAAVIGLGRIGKIHANNIVHQFSDVNLKAVVDPFLNKAYIRRLGVKKAYATTKPVFEDPDIDAVVICAPTDEHVSLITQAAKAKKAVFCEKPVSHSPAEITKLMKIVEKAGIPLQIGFNRRFDGNFKAVKAKILDGSIGKPHILRITSRDPAPPPVKYIRHSGGLFNDMTIHDFDMVRFLSADKVVKVYAEGRNLIDPKIGRLGDIDTAVIILDLKSGAVAVIDNSRKSAYGYDQRVEVFGSKGSILAENECPNTTILMTEKGVKTEKPLHFFLERYQDSYRKELGEFFHKVQKSRTPTVGLGDVRSALLLAQAANKSVKTGKPVSL